MKRKMIISLLISVTVVLISLYVGCTTTKPLPEKYKSYQDIAEIKQTPKYNIIHFQAMETNIQEPYLDNINQYVLLRVSKGPKVGEKGDFIRTYYKLDYNGTIVDSLQFINLEYDYLSKFFLSKDLYISWCIDGSKEKKEYKDINKDMNMDSIQLKQAFSNLYKQADLVYYRPYYNFSKTIDAAPEIDKVDRAYFFDGSQWFCLYGKKIVDLESFPQKGEYVGLALKDYFERVNLAKAKSDKFHLEYFHREKYFRKKWFDPSVFSPTYSPSPSHWEGTGFMNIMLKNDTLKIKKSMEESKSKSEIYFLSPCSLYTNEKLNFLIWVDRYNYYIVKPKNK